MNGLDRLGIAPANRRLVGVMYAVFFVNGLMSVMLGPLLPYIKDMYNLDYTQSGLLLSAHQVGNLSAVLLAGVLPSILGRKNSVLLLGSGMALGMLGMTLWGNPALLMIAYGLTGIGRGNWSNICNTVVGESTSSRAAALNALHASFAAGALLSPLVVAACVRWLWGWKSAAHLVALLGLAALVCIFRSSLSGKPPRQKSSRAEPLRVLRNRSFWIVTGILFFYIGMEASIIGWFVTYFSDAGVLTPAISALTPTMLWIMILAGRLACSACPPRVNRYYLTLGMGISFFLFFLVMLLSRNSAVSVVCLLGIGFSMAGIYPTALGSMKAESTPMTNGLCIGIATVGAIVLPGVVGAVADRRGLPGGVAFIAVFAVGMLACMVLNLLDGKRAKEEPAAH